MNSVYTKQDRDLRAQGYDPNEHYVIYQADGQPFMTYKELAEHTKMEELGSLPLYPGSELEEGFAFTELELKTSYILTAEAPLFDSASGERLSRPVLHKLTPEVWAEWSQRERLAEQQVVFLNDPLKAIQNWDEIVKCVIESAEEKVK